MTLIELLIGLIPAFCLIATLIAGRYPGEEMIYRFAQGKLGATRKRAPRALSTKPRRPRALVRTGELIARSLATRPPPALTVS